MHQILLGYTSVKSNCKNLMRSSSGQHGSVSWTLFWEVKGHLFQVRVHAWLWVRFPSRVHVRDNQPIDISFSHQFFSPSLSSSLSSL